MTTTNVQPVTANAGPAQTTSAGSPLTFSQATATGTAPLAYAWNFGDGTTSTGTLYPTHSYQTAGTYTATLTVTDALGIPATSTVTVTVDATGGPASVLLGDGRPERANAGSLFEIDEAALNELAASDADSAAAELNDAGNRIGALDFGDDNRPVVTLVLGETSTNSNALDRYTRQRPL